MTNIDYLDAAISTCFTMRKIKRVIIEQKARPFKLRPQNHLLIVSPFGTFKSSITQRLKLMCEQDIFVNDDFTKPSIEGSISKDGDYVPSILVNVGGKIFVVDEWNSVGAYGQNSMLSLLENQESSRSLGFKVKKEYKFRDKHGFVDYRVKENTINIKATFSCIAYAMEYPTYDNSQKSKALLSRFSPLFIQPTKEFMKSGTLGEFDINIEDHSRIIDEITIPSNIYREFHAKYYDYINDKDLWPADTHDYGFVSRTLAELTRYGIYHFLKDNKYHNETKKIKEVQVDDSSYFERSFDFVQTMLLQFTNPVTKDKIVQYRLVKEKNPKANKTQLARMMGVSLQTISNYEEKMAAKK